MKSWKKLIKRVLVAASCIFFSGLINAATIESTDVLAGDGLTYSPDIFDLVLSAYNISDSTTNTSINESFNLSSTFVVDLGTYQGSLSVGSLLAASFADLTYSEDPFGGGTFSASLSYTGGSLKGSYAGGSLTGNFLADGSVFATVAEVQAVPVPAAVWLFGSGLLGLIGLARKKIA